ncbi:MAG: Hsp33 family molecular chaperone HslO [Bacillota bacterium]
MAPVERKVSCLAGYGGDYLVRATAEGGRILALVARSTELVREGQRLHGTSPTATAAFGRVLTAAALMGATLKDRQSLTLRVLGDGPLGGIVATVREMRIKGYVREPFVDLPLNDAGKLDVAGAVGKGTLYVTRDLGLREPYNGSVPLVSGEIGKDLAHYFRYSEQTPAAVALGVLVGPDAGVRAAGGYILQLLPGAGEETAARLEANIGATGPVSRLIDRACTPEDILAMLLDGFSPRVEARQAFRFACDCSRERLREILVALGREELEELLAEQGGAEARCAFCNRVYRFGRDELAELVELAADRRRKH